MVSTDLVKITSQRTRETSRKISVNPQCTEGWDCDLGSEGLEIFFANKGLGGFLGPNWKVFHHGTLCEHFQGVVIAFRSQPGGENRGEIR